MISACFLFDLWYMLCLSFSAIARSVMISAFEDTGETSPHRLCFSAIARSVMISAATAFVSAIEDSKGFSAIARSVMISAPPNLHIDL